MQVQESSHQPQSSTAVQAPHAWWAAQGSVAEPPQVVDSHDQSAQAPVAGAEMEPVRQEPSSSHQPQLARPVQASQAVESPQGSVVEVEEQASAVQATPSLQSAATVQPVRQKPPEQTPGSPQSAGQDTALSRRSQTPSPHT